MRSWGRSHMFKNAKADGSEAGGSVVTFCKPGWRSRELGQATSSMPENKELMLPRHELELPFGVSVLSGLRSGPVPCPPECINWVLSSLAPSRAGGGKGSGGGAGTTVVELRGWRKTWLSGGGTGLVSRSAGPTRVAAEVSWAQGLRAGGCCPQEASKCLRILVALLVTGPGLPAPSSCSRCRQRRRTCS